MSELTSGFGEDSRGMTLLLAIGDLEAARSGSCALGCVLIHSHADLRTCTQEVMPLRDLEGPAIAGMAQRLGLAHDAVESRLHRALALARQCPDP